MRRSGDRKELGAFQVLKEYGGQSIVNKRAGGMRRIWRGIQEPDHLGPCGPQ